MSESTLANGGRILVDQLVAEGVDRIFGVPGESYLAVLDALYDTPEVTYHLCRQEGGAAMMADAYGKLTGRPGICFVTRGPGATSASAGVHIAFQDSTPMILFIGQVGRGMTEREAFQEIDYRRMYGEMAKWVAQIDDAARIPEMVSRAFHTATSGRPGPVVLALPEDMLSAPVPAPLLARPYHASAGAPEPHLMAELWRRLQRARRPLVIVGGGGWSAEAKAELESFAAANSLPVAASFRCQDYFDNTHPCYVGQVGIAIDPRLAARVRETDLLILLGSRFGEMTSGGYSLMKIPNPDQPLVHVYPDAEELGRVYRPELAIHAGSAAFVRAANAMPALDGSVWQDWTAAAHADYLAHNTPTTIPGRLQMGKVMDWLRETLPPEAIITNGAGNYTGWVHRFYRFRHFRSQLAPTSGSMGYGLPAAVAAKAVHPDRPVVCFAGDGCFMMHGQELATAVQYGLNIIVIVVNNASLGTIRMHQENHYPARVSATDLVNPDFAALARAYGAHGELVEDDADFAAAFQRAQASGKPALLELRIDPEAITPSATLSGLRAKALAK
ncbi:thiamine pyrophosphate-binding protein [Pelagibius sp. 7325]|uniref:thiamine pyrophosphate-binding protein n=1 Tax=Pelagibius sp. 7325 TaxID=3131994 RepID=UPI0030EE55DD